MTGSHGTFDDVNKLMEDEWPRTQSPQVCGRSANETSAFRYRTRT